MKSGASLQNNLLLFVMATLKFLLVFSLFLLVIFLLSTYMHSRRKKYLKKNGQKIKKDFEMLLHGDISIKDMQVVNRFKNNYKDIFVSLITDENRSTGNALYKEMGFFDDEVKLIRKGAWWQRMPAVQRFEKLKVPDLDDIILNLLDDKRTEVRFVALKKLAATGNKELLRALPSLFSKNSRWLYKAMTNILFSANVPVHYIKPLAESEDRDLRKAAAILLERSEAATVSGFSKNCAEMK